MYYNILSDVDNNISFKMTSYFIMRESHFLKLFLRVIFSETWNLEMKSDGIVKYKIKLSTEKWNYTLNFFFFFVIHWEYIIPIKL